MAAMNLTLRKIRLTLRETKIWMTLMTMMSIVAKLIWLPYIHTGSMMQYEDYGVR